VYLRVLWCFTTKNIVYMKKRMYGLHVLFSFGESYCFSLKNSFFDFRSLQRVVLMIKNYWPFFSWFDEVLLGFHVKTFCACNTLNSSSKSSFLSNELLQSKASFVYYFFPLFIWNKVSPTLIKKTWKVPKVKSKKENKNKTKIGNYILMRATAANLQSFKSLLVNFFWWILIINWSINLSTCQSKKMEILKNEKLLIFSPILLWLPEEKVAKLLAWKCPQLKNLLKKC